MSIEQIDVSIRQVLKNIDLISSDAISESHWLAVFELTSGIDEKDTPFVATAISIGGVVWTGDKKLVKGLREKGFYQIFSSIELLDQRE